MTKGHPEPTEFIPKNPEKYIGKLPIIMRSSWEKHFANILDIHPNVLFWASESIIIQYYNPVKQRMANYHTDFIAEFINESGDTVIQVLEVKPFKEANPALLLMNYQKLLNEDHTTKPPAGIASKARSARSRAYEDSMTMINAAKWMAAEAYCIAHGFEFKILTEQQLFGKM